MEKEYLLILEKAKSRYNQTKKSMSILSKRSIKSFDRILQSIHGEVFEKIDCTKCANCCRKLGPMFNETDIEKMSSHCGLRRKDFIEKYLRMDEDNDYVFISMPCPFALEDNLCSVYEIRPRACREYPHTDEKNMQPKLSRLAQNTLYCPAAYLISEKLIEQLC